MQFFCTEAYITVFEGRRKGAFCKIEDKNYSKQATPLSSCTPKELGTMDTT